MTNGNVINNGSEVSKAPRFSMGAKLAFGFALFLGLSGAIAGCATKAEGPAVVPFSIEKYCSGAQSLSTPWGAVYEVPEVCGSVLISADRIQSSLTEEGKPLGRAYVDVFLADSTPGQEKLGSNLDSVFIKPGLQPCLEKILVEKEIPYNAAVQDFLTKSGFINYFVVAGDDGKPIMSDGGWLLGDTLAITALLDSMSPDDIQCLQNNKVFFPDQLDRILNSGKYGSLEALTADEILTQEEACTILKRAGLVIGNANPTSQAWGAQELRSFTNALCGE